LPLPAQNRVKSPGLGTTRHTFRRVADEASKAETSLSGFVSIIAITYYDYSDE